MIGERGTRPLNFNSFTAPKFNETSAISGCLLIERNKVRPSPTSRSKVGGSRRSSKTPSRSRGGED